MAKKSQGGDLVRRTFNGPSLAPYGGTESYQMPGFHKKPDGSDAVEMDKQAKRDKISKSAPKPAAGTDASFFKHTIKDNK